MNNNQVLIERKDGVSIYGQIISPLGRIGKFTVYSPYSKNNNNEYALLSDAQKKMKELIGVHSNS